MAQLVSLLRTCFPRNITKAKAAYSDVHFLIHPIYQNNQYKYMIHAIVFNYRSVKFCFDSISCKSFITVMFSNPIIKVVIIINDMVMIIMIW